MKTIDLLALFLLIGVIPACTPPQGTSWQYWSLLNMQVMGKSFSKLSYDECKDAVALRDLLAISQKKGFIGRKSAEFMDRDGLERPYLFERTSAKDQVVFRISCLRDGEQKETPENVECLCEVTVPITGKGTYKLTSAGKDVTPK